MSTERDSAIEFVAKGLTYKKRETATGKAKFGGFIGVVVSVEAGRVYVTERAAGLNPAPRSDLGPASAVTVTAQRQMHLVLVTLVGNGNTCPVRMNPAAVDSLQAALRARQTEAQTSRDAAAVAEAIERFAELLARGLLTQEEFAVEKAKLLGAA